jgi:hypothetical protein
MPVLCLILLKELLVRVAPLLAHLAHLALHDGRRPRVSVGSQPRTDDREEYGTLPLSLVWSWMTSLALNQPPCFRLGLGPLPYLAS